MAKISNPLIGAARGRVGGVVMYRRKGENVMREYVAQIDDKNTGQQSQNRIAFIALVRVLKIIKFTIASFFTPSRSNQTPWSDCVGYNALNTITNDSTEKYDQYEIPYFDRIFKPVDIKHADLSQCPLGAFECTNPTAGTIHVAWDESQLGIGGLSSDLINCYIVNTTLQQIIGEAAPWTMERSDISYDITYPPSWEDSDSLLIVLIRPADHSLSARQATISGSDLANKLK